MADWSKEPTPKPVVPSWAKPRPEEVRPWSGPKAERRATSAPAPPEEPRGSPPADPEPTTPPPPESPETAEATQPEPDAAPTPGRMDERLMEEALEPVRQRYLAAAADLARTTFELQLRVDRDLIRLARRLAEAIVHRVIELDEDVLIDNLRHALGVAGPIETVTIRCAEEDAARLREAAPELAQDVVGRWVDVLVRPSEDIPRGGLMLLFDEGIVDARVSTQMRRLTEAVERAVAERRHQSAPGAEED